MQPWSITRYRRPFLDVDAVSVSSGAVTLRQRGTSYDLTTSAVNGDAKSFAGCLRDLRRPDSPRWVEVLGGAGTWNGLLDQLDRLGLISDDDGKIAPFDPLANCRAVAEQCARWIASATPPAGRRALTASARDLKGTTNALIGGDDLSRRMLRTDNFLRDVLVRQLHGWARTAPQTLVAADMLLGTLAGAKSAAAGRLLDRDGSGLYDPQSVRTHLDAFCALLALSTGPGRWRLSTPEPSVQTRSGLNLMLEGERLAAQCLRELGDSEFQRKLTEGAVPPRVAKGVYIEQFHLSRRFVEILTALMRRQLRPELRDRLFQYYAEEVGHESFERAAALSVGVSEEELERSIQLPLFAAYVDVLTEMSDRDPVGLLLSLLVAEGFPGTSTPVNDGLERSGLAARSDAVRKHEALNVELHHSTAPRLLLSSIPSVEPSVQRVALADLAMMVELNFRAWNMFLKYYENDRLPFPYSGLVVPGLPSSALA